MEDGIWICLRLPMWVLLLGLFARFDVIDARVAGRHQKQQELLQSLGTFSKRRVTHMIHKNHSSLISSSSALPTVATFSKEMPQAFGSQNLNNSSIKSYQDFYRVFYGTHEGMEHIRKKYGPAGLQQARIDYGFTQEINDVRRANEHYMQIRTRARCKVPAARVIRVQDIHPDRSKEYLPRCTILHRCSESSGCCETDVFQCVANTKQEVALHFYVLNVGKHGPNYKTGNSIQPLFFENHTSCHCLPVDDLLPRLQRPSNKHIAPQDGAEIKPAKEQQSKCRECPVPFTSRVYSDERCGCDCFDRERTCLKIKRGKDPLHDVERRCVEASYCHVPDCEYGLFNAETGYCPKRHDESPARTPSHRAHPASHRWSFEERD